MRPCYRNRLATTAGALALGFVSSVGAVVAPAVADEAAPVSIVRAPDDLPGPLVRRDAQTVVVELEAVELLGQLDDGTTYRYWTFDGKVPGPMVRVRVGDTVEVTMKNRDDSWVMHNVDFHAVTGPGGGGTATMTEPGGATGFTFKALAPGLYVYHCATMPHAQHIANGMYGMILVEPEEGLGAVDREFYVMQGEIYTEEDFGTTGELTESYAKLLDEQPEYFVFNGAVHGLKTEAPLKAKVGERVRIFFGVGGPNKASAFHAIGEIFDSVYQLGSLTGQATPDVQTVTVAPGGATVVEMTLDVPGRYILVDHALSRVERGLAAFLEAEGPENPAVYRAGQIGPLGALE
ncbi:MAG: nirK [Geminicoccaceae bacterium]|nr:nirK [Geminicoccaceae bacterium]